MTDKTWEPSHPGVQAAVAEAMARDLRRPSALSPGGPGGLPLKPEDIAAVCAAYEAARPKSFEESTRLDPATHLLLQRMADAFVQGSEAYMEEVAAELTSQGEPGAADDCRRHWHEKSWATRRNEACEAMVARHLGSERRAVEALALLGVRPLAPNQGWRQP